MAPVKRRKWSPELTVPSRNENLARIKETVAGDSSLLGTASLGYTAVSREDHQLQYKVFGSVLGNQMAVLNSRFTFRRILYFKSQFDPLKTMQTFFRWTEFGPWKEGNWRVANWSRGKDGQRKGWLLFNWNSDNTESFYRGQKSSGVLWGAVLTAATGSLTRAV